MLPQVPNQVTIAWTVTSLRTSDEGLEPPLCRGCNAPLNIHQPDEDRPEHLLGTCPGCGTWYLIELGKDHDEAFMVDLPNVALVHAAAAAARPRPAKKAPPKRKADSHVHQKAAAFAAQTSA